MSNLTFNIVFGQSNMISAEHICNLPVGDS